MVVEVLIWYCNWESMGFVKWEDKNGDGCMFYLGDVCNEMIINNDIIVLVLFEIVKLLNWVVVLLVVGGFVVVFFIVVGLLLVILIVIFYDLLKKGFKFDMIDK